MIQAWRFIRQWWWTFIAAAGAIFMIAWRLMARPSAPPGTTDQPDAQPPPTFSDRAHEQVERVKLEGDVEKARVKATSDLHHAEIDRIQDLGETNPQEARRQLASWITQNV